jgi:membrane fusion protein (multidrug efflux system)
VKRRTKLISSLLMLAAAALVIGGIAERKRTLMGLAQTAEEQAEIPVEVIAPQPAPPTRSLTLPGTARAWHEAPIFAQVAGYVDSWYEDYGATVRAGQILATIDAPSLDAQYAAAKATLGVAQANYRLAMTTAARWQALAGTPAVSKQEVDVQVAGAAARKAELESAQQEVARYAALKAFKRVVAPFDGVVTARLTDVGSYVNAAGGDSGVRSGSTELFSVADVHEIRVFVAVPQDYAPGLNAGVTATLHLPSQPGRPIAAKFLTTARAFNPDTRTAVTELTVDNSDHAIWPGTYVDVEFQVPTDPRVLTVPEQALIFRAAGIQLAIVDSQRRVHLRNVTLGENLGEAVQITSGLAPTDRLVNNPSAGLLEGARVRPVNPAGTYVAASKATAPPPGATSGDGRTGTP